MPRTLACRDAAEDARELCLYHLGDAPRVTFHGQADVEFTYVPRCPASAAPSHAHAAARATHVFVRSDAPAVRPKHKLSGLQHVAVRCVAAATCRSTCATRCSSC